MKYIRFEDIPVWQEVRRFVTKIYHITKRNFNNDFGLMNQVRRAALSMLLNIAEGFERKSNKDFARFVNQAKASCGESRAALYVASDLKYLTDKELDDLINDSLNIARQLSKFETYLINSHKK